MPISRTDYSSYHPNIAEKLICSIMGFASGAFVGYTFYEHAIAAIIGAVAASVYVNIQYVKYRTASVKKKLILQFRDMLESLTSSVSAGSNTRNAFLSAHADMHSQHGEESYIVRELQLINRGVMSNENLEQLLMSFGERSGLPDIMGFANVFETCYRLGGNINDVISMTCRVICDKIEVRQEIMTVVSAKKAEQYAMLVMPIVFVLLLKGLGAGVADMASASGRVASTIALALFATAHFISGRILRIVV